MYDVNKHHFYVKSTRLDVKDIATTLATILKSRGWQVSKSDSGYELHFNYNGYKEIVTLDTRWALVDGEYLLSVFLLVYE
ncbi:hypothetical protein [Ralstonia phage RSP15]|uniref:hypothetical protein n=1 Tax=Ralstonia phage RSP15 TaxID=1785960 RepID=UPI00074D3350|nr:hypothetical protein BH754_gp130 [Ralstonia phage RSP15]BAU40176.1 hypothetical protein [Ralstonia phage RSP15]